MSTPTFCPHCGLAVGAKRGDDTPYMIGWHTWITPRDGFRVVRISSSKTTLYLELHWRGSKFKVRLLKTKAEIYKVGKENAQ